MKNTVRIAAAMLLTGIFAVAAGESRAQTPADVDKVVGAVKAKNTDFRALCQSGADKIRQEVGAATTALATSGQIQNPQATGQAAGVKIRTECGG